MAKEKRTFKAEVLAPASLRLEKSAPTAQKQTDRTVPQVAPRQFFAPELIHRLAEKIKKL